LAGIAGIDGKGKRKQVRRMLSRISHRGNAGSRTLESRGATLGALWPEVEIRPTPTALRRQAVWDGEQPPLPDPETLSRAWEPFALAAATPDGLFLARDPLGVRPLYYGRTDGGALCFASEVKALLGVTPKVTEFPPGCWYDSHRGMQPFFSVETEGGLTQDKDEIAAGLRLRLERAVCNRIDGEVMGSWLSGGLDSSAMVALARPHLRELHTFAAGVAGAPDLACARQVAQAHGTKHHEVLVTLDDMLAALPDVIYHLESFDALLVRSSITNYLVAGRASDYVGSVFSGEGGDELFAGYAYLKGLPDEKIHNELVEITGRLHNTALQRVDRSASAHGLVAHVPFLDPEVVGYALRIPAELKLRREGQATEKWILRRALAGLLPDGVLWRPKAKFWQGAGVRERLAAHAQETISDAEFRRERRLANGWTLNTKEELMYYRSFRERFGVLTDLSWVGRTKGAPVQ
jgi:asparagine synthase (glutamine-hydrolysing)